MRRVDPSQRTYSKGFTLLEIVLAMFIFALLITAIFAIVNGTTQLADEMEQGHEHDAQVHGFLQLCERTFARLPAQAEVRLRVKQSGKHYLSELAIMDAPTVLGAGGAGGGNAVTILETEEQPDGYLRVVLKLLSEEEAAANEKGQHAEGRRLPLLADVARCEWRFFNPISNEWEPMWNDKMTFVPVNPVALPIDAAPPPSPVAPPPPQPQPGANGQPPLPVAALNQNPFQRPNLIELTLAQHTGPPQRLVFWVPPAQSPRAAGR
jgi:prepilin-type N-terminal cleavage/methylation domain-containing protein